jgi:hypothetical protein
LPPVEQEVPPTGPPWPSQRSWTAKVQVATTPSGIRDSDRLHRLHAWDRRRRPPKLVDHRGCCASTMCSRTSAGAVARSAHPGLDQARTPSAATSIRPLHAQQPATAHHPRRPRASFTSPRSHHRGTAAVEPRRQDAPGPRGHAATPRVGGVRGR